MGFFNRCRGDMALVLAMVSTMAGIQSMTLLKYQAEIIIHTGYRGDASRVVCRFTCKPSIVVGGVDSQA